VALLSVVLPTYNEVDNVRTLVPALRVALEGHDVEILVVDDASPDGTAEVARSAGCRVIERTERGLATAAVRGIEEARGTYVLVMDADWQHPPEVAARLLQRALETDAGLVVGAREQAKGGFGPVRRLISGGAALLALALPPVRRARLTDPMSGLFLVRRDRVDTNLLRPHGYKVLLEILGRCDVGRVEQVPYRFGARRAGDSKLGAAVIVQYLTHLAALAWAHPDNQRLLRFAAVGATGVVVNLLILYGLTDLAGVYYLLSAAISVEASIVWNFFLNDRFTFHDRRRGHRLERLARFNAVSLLALVVNLSVLYILTSGAGLHYLLSEAIAIVVSFGANYAGNLHWTYGGIDRFRMRTALMQMLPWLPLVVIVAGFGGLVFHDLDRPDEIYFDEHYYVSVAYQYNAGVIEDPCWINDQRLDHRPLNFEHPPLAKRIIAFSVRHGNDDVQVFEGCRAPDGDEYAAFTKALREDGDQVAWRTPSALFGIATVAFAGLAAGRLFQSPLAAALAAGLTAVDGVVFTSSRMAILDIFATGFVMAALWAATYANRRGMYGAATLLALGFACKFTAAFAGIGVLAVVLWAHHNAGKLERRVFDRALAAFAIIPLLVLVASYGPWWRLWVSEQGLLWAIGHWLKVQAAGVAWTGTVQSDHPFSSDPIRWFALERPVFYYVMNNVDGVEGVNRYIYGMGNPAVWWAGAAATLTGLGLGVRALWQKRPVPPLALAALAPFAAYVCFVALPRESFMFYMTVIVPLLAVVAAGALDALYRMRFGYLAVGIVAAAAVFLFGHYLPILWAETISEATFDEIIRTLPWTLD